MRYRDIVGRNIINEDETPVDNARYEPENDTFTQQQLGNTRKPKLTLRMVNRLKKIRATKKLEMAKKEGLLGVMYGVKPESDGPV